MSEAIPPRPPRPSGSSAGPPRAATDPTSPEESPLSSMLKNRAADVKEGMKELTAASQVLAAETRSINTENERYKGSVVDTAVSAMTSQTDVMQGANQGEVQERAMSGPSGTIKIEPRPQPQQPGGVAGGIPTKVDPMTAILVQTIAAGLGAGINTVWIAYINAQGAPADLLNLLPGLATWLVLQGGATVFNNRKAS